MYNTSPQITSIKWGKIEVAELSDFKDAKLWPGGGRVWDWGETGTRHVPGIQVADAQELIEKGAEVLVLSQGMQLALHTAPETIDYLDSLDIEYHVLETKDAVQRYNDLVMEGVKVGGLFHSTC